MPKLTPEGEIIAARIAERYKIGTDAVKAMLDAVAAGGGTMAQFNVPELGGAGQWMCGGMTMVGDMFNNSLKASVDNLCTELSNLIVSEPSLFAPVSQSQWQNQGGPGRQGVSVFVPQSSSGWWPPQLGAPSSTGSQNTLRYAYFPGSNRLAIDYGARVEVYDTTGHSIYGFGQQQSGDASLTFTSQHGVVRVDSLPRAGGEMAAAASKSGTQESAAAGGEHGSNLALLEQLAALKEKGILTEEEFAAKKQELLKRL
jgi:Short C-terminal domain